MDLTQSEAFDRHSTTWTDLIAIFRRRLGLVVLVVLSTVLGAYGALQFLTERYETQVRLLVKLGRENTELPVTVQKSNFFSTGIRREEVTSEMILLSSRNLIEAVVDTIGPDAFRGVPPPPQTLMQKVKYYARQGVRWAKELLHAFLIAVDLRKSLSLREEAILGVEGALKTEVEKNSDVISARLRLPNPDLSMRVLETLVRLYLEKRIQVRRFDKIEGFFDDQVTQRRQQLQDLETTREEIKAKWGLIAAPQQRTLLLEQSYRLQERIVTSDNEKFALLAQQKTLRRRLAALADETRGSYVTTPNPAMQSIKERLTTLELRRIESLPRYTPDSQTMKNLDMEIAGFKDKLAAEARTIVGSMTMQANPLKQTLTQTAQDLDIKIAGVEASIEQLRKDAAVIEERLRQINTGERQLETLERERQIAELNYLNYVKSRDEARAAEEMDVRRFANISVLSPPMRPIEPVYPRKMLLMMVSLPVGLLLGIALAFFLEYTNDVVNTQHDLVGLNGLPYLGTFHLSALTHEGDYH
jgi:uncharacterized protein involved in exopolysaccharide biosynthesis